MRRFRTLCAGPATQRPHGHIAYRRCCPRRLGEHALPPTRLLDAGKMRALAELLPALRERSHLHNLIYRHKHNATLGLCRRADGALLGGATFRAYWVRGEAGGRRQQQLVGPNGGLAPGRRIVLEVLLIVVGQRPGVCGHGHGTRRLACISQRMSDSFPPTDTYAAAALAASASSPFWATLPRSQQDTSSHVPSAYRAPPSASL